MRRPGKFCDEPSSLEPSSSFSPPRFLHPVAPRAVVALAKTLAYPAAYDVAYLVLAEALKVLLLTTDRRLYNAVHGKFPWIAWITDFLARG